MRGEAWISFSRIRASVDPEPEDAAQWRDATETAERLPVQHLQEVARRPERARMTKMLRLTEEQFAARQLPSAPSQFWDKAVSQLTAASPIPQFIPAATPIKQRKYRNVKTLFDRIQFDSLREMRRYVELRQLEGFGLIRNLVVHPVFLLEVDGQVIGRYRADFAYHDVERGIPEVVEDVKGPATAKLPATIRTLKHIKSQYGIDVRIV